MKVSDFELKFTRRTNCTNTIKKKEMSLDLWKIRTEKNQTIEHKTFKDIVDYLKTRRCTN